MTTQLTGERMTTQGPPVAQEARGQAQNVAQEAKGQAQNVAQEAKGQVQNVAQEAKSQARDLTGELRSQLVEQSDTQRDRVVSTLRELGGEKLEKTGRMLRKHGVSAALAVSIVPVAPFPMVGMTAGAAKVRLWHFLTGVSLGMLPGTIATAVFTCPGSIPAPFKAVSASFEENSSLTFSRFCDRLSVAFTNSL